MKDIKRINKTEVTIDGDVYVKREEPKSEYTKGKWYITYSGNIKYLILFDRMGVNCMLYIVYNTTYFTSTSVFTRIERAATEEEIASHLKKICEEKYIGKKIQCLSNYIHRGVVTNVSHGVPYWFNEDEYWMIMKDGYGVCVYKQGKFAEIIPDKKPLPKTREEYFKFIRSISNTNNDSIDNYLDKFDIK